MQIIYLTLYLAALSKDGRHDYDVIEAIKTLSCLYKNNNNNILEKLFHFIRLLSRYLSRTFTHVFFAVSSYQKSFNIKKKKIRMIFLSRGEMSTLYICLIRWASCAVRKNSITFDYIVIVLNATGWPNF